MWAAPMQYDRSTTSSSGSPQRTVTRMASWSTTAVASAPSGDTTGWPGAIAPEPVSNTTASAHPAARRLADVGGPGTSTSSTFRPGATAATASAIPGVRTTRSRPVPSARAPPATGGRLAPVSTESSRDTRATTGHPCSLARERAAAGASEPSLAPKAPPLANGLAGSPPGTHHEASVSR